MVFLLLNFFLKVYYYTYYIYIYLYFESLIFQRQLAVTTLAAYFPGTRVLNKWPSCQLTSAQENNEVSHAEQLLTHELCFSE